MNCTAALLTMGGTGGKRKKGKSAEKILRSKIYHAGRIFRGQYNMDETKIDISNTHLVGIADTTGWECCDSQCQYILL